MDTNDLQIVEIQKGLSLFCSAKVQQISDIKRLVAWDIKPKNAGLGFCIGIIR